MKKPLISVVMSVFNEPENYLRESIESILKQTISDFEFIIIVDNPEYKKAHEIIKSYTANDNRIKIVLNKENEGLAKCLNKGFSISRGRYIARMDADDISVPQRLENQLIFMKNHPDLMLIGSSMVYIDENKNDLESKFARGDYNFLKRFILYGGTPCFHPTWFFKKDLLDKIKGYRNLPISQDFDFLMRTFYLGIKASNIQEPLLYHRIHFAGVSAEKNIYQLKLTRYIIKAVKKGFIMDDKKFSPEVINKIIKTPRLFYFLHKVSLRLYIFSCQLRNDNRKLSAFLLYSVSILVSPSRLYYAFRSIVRSLILIKSEIGRTWDEPTI